MPHKPAWLCIVAALIFCAALDTADARQPSKIAYLTSWGLPNDAFRTLKRSTADAYILSFARWDENGRISASDDLLSLPQKSPKIVPKSYQAWTQLAYHSAKTKMLVSFGGQEYEDIWQTMGDEQSTTRIAQNIAALLQRKFPVYELQQCVDNEIDPCDERAYQLIGHTELSGVDFDYEQAARLTEMQNVQLTQIVRQLRHLVGNTKTIDLTSYHVGADPLNCSDSRQFKNCSFTQRERSIHHGEVTTLLSVTRGLFDFYNVMTYDAGRDFDYSVAMQNYARITQRPEQLRLGLSINQQWGPAGNFVMPHNENLNRLGWLATQEYGGFFVWALGASSEMRHLESQVDVFNQFTSKSKR